MTNQETKVDWSRPGEPGYWEQQREQFAKNAKNSPANRALALVRRMALHPLDIAGPIGRIDLEDAREIAAEADHFQEVTNIVPTPSPELTARVVEFVREVAGMPIPTNGFYIDQFSELRDKARAIAAELEPVDGLIERAVVTICGDAMQHDVSLRGPAELIIAGAPITSIRALERGQAK